MLIFCEFMKHLIIHKSCINEDLNRDSEEPYLMLLNKKQRRRLLAAKKIIEDVIEEGKMNQKDVTDYWCGEATKVDKLFETGDKVMLYGAYINNCLEKARQVLEEEKGVSVEYHPIGCVKCY